MPLPIPRREKIQSYGGDWVITDVYPPANEHDLVDTFAYARGQNLRVTIRGGGNAFDTQSLNDALVVSMENFTDAPVLDVAAQTVRVGAAVGWGEVFDAIVPQGFVPYVTVTSDTASVGGTVSSDCLSRFSPTLGREGGYVTELHVVPFDGAPFDCSPALHPQVFNAIIAGLGYLGAITHVTFRVYQLPFAGEPLVETRFRILHDVNQLDQVLFEELAQTTPGGEPIAIAATAYIGRFMERAAVMTSRYVDPNTVPADHPQSFLFRPKHFLHLLTQTAFLVPAFRPFLWWTAFNTFLRTDNTSWDTLWGWTFFQTGNATIKKRGRQLGLLMGTRQQTFILPFDVLEAGPGADHLSRFLRSATQVFRSEARQVPALIDILYLPRDVGQVPVLCPTSAEGGFAVTFAFETSLQRRLRRVEQAFRTLSQVAWDQHDGRVHLVKHVFAEPALLEQMYPWQVFRDRKALVDSSASIRNAFLGRVFPQI